MTPAVGDRIIWKKAANKLPAGAEAEVIQVGMFDIVARTSDGKIINLTAFDFHRFSDLAILPAKKCCCKCHS